MTKKQMLCKLQNYIFKQIKHPYIQGIKDPHYKDACITGMQHSVALISRFRDSRRIKK